MWTKYSTEIVIFMVPSCDAIDCVNCSGKNPSLSFHQIPSNKWREIRQKWLILSNVDRMKDTFQRLYVFIVSRMRFWVKPHYSCVNVKELPAWNSCSHLNFKYCTCFKQEVPWLWGNCWWISSKTCTWHGKNIQWNGPYSLASLAKCLSVCLQTKWLWIRVSL